MGAKVLAPIDLAIDIRPVGAHIAFDNEMGVAFSGLEGDISATQMSTHYCVLVLKKLSAKRAVRESRQPTALQ